MFKIDEATANSHGGADAIRKGIDAFRKALIDHESTVGIAAPTAKPLIEEILRRHGGEFEVEKPKEIVDSRIVKGKEK